MSYLVDTDWLVDYLVGRPAAVALLDPLFRHGLAISIVTYTEVYEGIFFGTDPKRTEAIFRRFLEQVQVVGVSRPIARRCARLRGHLRGSGQTLPMPDLFIAATAIDRDLALLTRNVRHFGRVPGLKLYQTP